MTINIHTENGYYDLILARDRMTHTWRYIGVLNDNEAYIYTNMFPNETIAIKSLLGIKEIFEIKTSEDKDYVSVTNFVKRYYNGENIV